MGGSLGDVGEVPGTYLKQWKGCRMSCDVGEATEGLESDLLRRRNNERAGDAATTWLHLRLRHFAYVT